jgi:hypothetical protein
MTVTVEQLQDYVGSKETGTFIDGCLNSAYAMVQRFVGTNAVPSSIIDQAVLQVGSELFHRRSAPNGISQFADMSGNPMRVARDPMVAAYDLLRPYVGWAV